jgi:hypothetical protein
MTGFQKNSRLVVNGRMIGNNVKLFATLKGIMAVNEAIGKGECGTRVSNCFDEQAPILFGEYTKVNLPRNEWDIL